MPIMQLRRVMKRYALGYQNGKTIKVYGYIVLLDAQEDAEVKKKLFE